MTEFDDSLDLLDSGPDTDDSGFALEDDSTVTQLSTTDDPPPPLGRSWLFDMGAELFVRHGQRPQQVSGEAALIGWIDKYMHTERGALPIHPDWFGMPDPYAIFGRPVTELSEAELLDAMQNMTYHPNIAEVPDARLTIDPLDEAAYLEVDILSDPPSEDVALMTLRVRTGTG